MSPALPWRLDSACPAAPEPRGRSSPVRPEFVVENREGILEVDEGLSAVAGGVLPPQMTDWNAG